MKEVLILSIVFWIPVSIVLLRNYLWHTYFWQIKEYRWDRFINHILWDQDETNRVSWSIALKFILFAACTLIVAAPLSVLIAISASYIVWVAESITFIEHIISKKTHRPAIKSPRNILILGGLTVLSLGLIILITLPFLQIDRSGNATGSVAAFINKNTLLKSDFSNNSFPDVYIMLTLSTLLGLFLDIASPVITTIFVFLTAPFAFIRRMTTIIKARQKYNLIKDKVIIIGITGSQGKTTAKEILYELLKYKYKVAKTPENYNTDFGVAHSILTQIKGDTEIFIAEMGAYKKGEIARVCKYFAPNISIITDIDIQHLGLFGSREKVFEAKSEILTNMKEGGTAIINGDNKYAEKLALLSKGKTYAAVTTEAGFKKLKSSNIYDLILLKVSNIENKTNLAFSLETDKSKAKIVTKFKGEHLSNTVALVIAAGLELGMSMEEIAEKLKNINMELPRLSIDTGDNNTIILNDTYNSSYKGFLAAVKLMSNIYEGKDDEVKIKGIGRRIIVSKGIYELGKEKKKIYEELLNEVNKNADILITSDSALARTSIIENHSLHIYKVANHIEMIYKLREVIKPHDIILLEGRLHPLVIKEIVSDKF